MPQLHLLPLMFCMLVLCVKVGVTQSVEHPAKTIICLTYDDGLRSHLETVIPQLQANGLQATFFLNSIQGSSDRIGESSPALMGWKKAAAAGHELGNHTLFHPCPTQFGWNKEVAIESYTTTQLVAEVRTAAAMLDLIDNRKGPRSFAYPCNNVMVEGKPYASALKREGLIWCARDGGDSNSFVKDRGTLSIYRVPSWLVEEGTTTEALIAFAEKANKSGIMAVYQFHGIGAEFFTVSKEAHLGFLQYLKANKDRFEVMTFSAAIKRLDIR